MHIINLLQDSKFQHFMPVMDTYIEGHFAGALSYRLVHFTVRNMIFSVHMTSLPDCECGDSNTEVIGSIQRECEEQFCPDKMMNQHQMHGHENLIHPSRLIPYLEKHSTSLFVNLCGIFDYNLVLASLTGI